MAYNKPKGDVSWYKPKSKANSKPIAYSTVATNDLIVILSQIYDTIEDVYKAINYDQEAKEIMEKYINLGYGNYIARDYFK